LKIVALNTPPTERLDIYVCGDGECGELGLGPKPIEGKKPTHVTLFRRNKLLDAATVGVIQVAAGGMHCVSLTHDQKLVTWGVNDNGALGRDTSWEAPTRDMDQASNSEDFDDEIDLSPMESTPMAMPTENFGNSVPMFVQVVALDSASFALTSEGSVYGWGTFRVSSMFKAITTI
jgi:regulator of chromosome condensation